MDRGESVDFVDSREKRHPHSAFRRTARRMNVTRKRVGGFFFLYFPITRDPQQSTPTRKQSGHGKRADSRMRPQGKKEGNERELRPEWKSPFFNVFSKKDKRAKNGQKIPGMRSPWSLTDT